MKHDGRTVLLLERAGWSAALEAMLRAVVHDLRSPAQAVLLGARMLERDVPPAQRRQYCGILARESERIGAILDNLSGLLAPSAGVETVSVVDVVTSLGRQARAKGPSVRVECAGEVPPVHMVRRDLEQALHAVITNARQAMMHAPSGEIVAEVYTRSPFVTVTIVDSGPGIPTGLRRRVFDPFFTTRAESGALGLGLAAARLVLARHGGRIAVLPPVTGTGARVRLQLPACVSPPARRTALRAADMESAATA